jgi:FG-GAP repeat
MSVATIADINGDGKPDIVGAVGTGPTAFLPTKKK